MVYQVVPSESDSKVPVIKWHGTSDMTADDLLSALSESSEEKSALEEAGEFLMEALANGQAKQKIIMADARAEGVSERTLRRAKKKLGIRSDRIEREWYWMPPSK